MERLQAEIAERYAVERELGRGGMATVYLARDLEHDRLVAIKVLHPDLSVVLGPERFRREIHVVTALSHPHILPIYDFGEAADALYYVMPYVAGESLAARLRRERQLPVEEAVEITCQVASALDDAHRHGIIHRDIKPDNILLEDGQAIVADFGIARAVSDTGAEKLTRTGVTLGTPAYMSPEQAMAEREIDGRSDVYSLGCVLYEMLAGQPPFVGPTAQAIIARQMVGEVPSLIVVRGTIPEAIEDAVMRALAKVPADRFKTAAEFAGALQESLRSGGRSLGRTERRAHARRPAMRRRMRVLALAGAATVGLAAALGAWRMVSRPTRTSDGAIGAVGALPPQRVAVLYFDDLSRDHALAPFASGLTEDLIGALSQVRALDVVSRNGVARFRGHDVPPDSAAAALGAGTLVRGSVEQDGQRLHVAVRMVDGNSGVDLQRASFDYPAGAMLAIRDTLVRRVADLLRERLGEEVRLREQREGTRDVQAWMLVQRTERLIEDAEAAERRGDTTGAAQRLVAADSLLVRAADSDRAWIDPVVLRGRVALQQAGLHTGGTVEKRWVDSASARAEQALRMSPQSADALELRGTSRYVRWVHHLEPDPRAAATLLPGAEADLRQAVTIDPSRARAWYVLAGVYFQKPDLVEGTLATRRAYEEDAYLSEADDILWRLYTTSYDNEQFSDATHWCEEGRHRFPSDARFVRCQLWLLTTPATPPDIAAAWTLVEDVHPLTPPQDWPYEEREARMLVAAAIGRAGLRDSAVHVLERSRADARIDPERELVATEAFIRSLIGDRDEAFRLIKQYLAAKPEHRAGLATSQSWWWRDLKGDPRFKEIVGAGR